MRELSPYLLAAIAIFFIIFMVISDVGPEALSGAGRANPDAAIGSVNGEEITVRQFDARVQEQIEQERSQYQQQGQEVPEIDEERIRQTVWNTMVEEILLRQAAKKAGITVTREEMWDFFFDNPPDFLRQQFMDANGNFQRGTYDSVISNPDHIRKIVGPNSGQNVDTLVRQFKSYLLRVEDAILRERMSNNVRSLVNASAAIISPAFLENQYMMENSTADVNYVAFDIFRIADTDVKVSDEELRAYYDKHKQYFIQKPMRKIKYVSFPLEPSSKDTLNARSRISSLSDSLAAAGTPEKRDSVFNEYFLRFSGTSQDYTLISSVDPERQALIAEMQPGDVRGPVNLAGGVYFLRLDDRRNGQQESVRASHILLAFGNNKDSARQEAENLLRRARAGEDFGNLAMQYSTDKGSGQQGGDLGYFGRGRMVKPFEDAAFGAAPGSIVGPVESEFGWHIIKVVDKTSTEVKFSEINIPVATSTITRNALYRNAFTFKTLVEEGEDFDSLAKKQNKSAVETVFFERSSPVLGSQKVTAFVFENDPGTVSDPIELKFFGVVVAQVTQARQAGIRPFEDMKDELRTRLLRIKKLDIAKARAEDYYKKVASLDSLSKASALVPGQEVRSASGLKVNGAVPGVGQDVIFGSAVMNAPLGKITGPVRGERAYFVMQVLNRSKADPNQVKANYKNLYEQAQNTARASAYHYWFARYKETSDIEDNRSKFYDLGS